MTIDKLKIGDKIIVNFHEYTFKGIEKRSNGGAKIEYFILYSEKTKMEKLFERHNKNILKHDIRKDDNGIYIW